MLFWHEHSTFSNTSVRIFFLFCCPKSTWIGKVKYLVVSMKTQRFIFSATKFTFLSPFFLTPSNQSSWFGNFSTDSTVIGRKGECFFAKLLPYRDQLQFFQFMSNFLNFINLIFHHRFCFMNSSLLKKLLISHVERKYS